MTTQTPHPPKQTSLPLPETLDRAASLPLHEPPDLAAAPSLPGTPGPGARPGSAAAPSRAAVEIVIPVYNEERVLAQSVRTLRSYMRDKYTFPFRITIADNASTDGTFEVAEQLCREFEEVDALYLEEKGRGRALRAAWNRSDADIVAYMDVDLSTDLSALPALLEPLLQRQGDIAIGSRLAPGADVTRGFKREFISRSYNLMLRALLGVTFSDAQCGFKAGRREIVQPLLEEVADEAWFFDTELLYLAQRRSLSILEVPVRWVDDPDSRVDIVATAKEDLRGVLRLRAAERAKARPASAKAAAERAKPRSVSGRPRPARPVSARARPPRPRGAVRA